MKQTSIYPTVKQLSFSNELKLVVIFTLLFLLNSVFAFSQNVDITVAKTVSDLTPNENQSISYTVTASNNGPANASNVVIKDILPGGITFVSASATQGTYDVNTGLWNVGSINKSAVKTLTINVTVNSFTSGQTVSNSASLYSVNQTDVLSSNDYASVDFTVNSADLQLTKTVNNTSPAIGNTIRYTINVKNNGPSFASGIKVTDTLPAGLTYVTSSTTNGSYNPATKLWTFASQLNSGANVSLTIDATVNTGTAAQVITNTAAIYSFNQHDDITTNNSASASLTVDGADLRITKQANVTSAVPGNTIVYTVTVTNNGPLASNDVQIQDILPAGLTYVSSSATESSYNPATHIWGGTNLDLALNETRTLTINATVNTGTLGSAITNTASVTYASQPDSYTSNNSDSAMVIIGSTDLSITNSVSNSIRSEGDAVVYTVTVTNNGPYAAAAFSVSDILPALVSFVSSSATLGSYNSTTGLWSFGNSTLSATTGSNTAVLTINATVNNNTAGYLVSSTANISTSQSGNNTSNDTSRVSFQVSGADLQVSTTSSNAAPVEGESFSYTITVTNNGPNAVSNVTVSDALPVGLRFVSATTSNGAYSSATGNWTGISLANGASATLIITTNFEVAKTLVNTATITSSSELDANTTNNSSSITVAGYKNFAAGACIINMGVTPQTYNNGLRPYGLVYQLVRTYKIPVYWSVNPNKTFVDAANKVDQTDFTVSGTSYKGGAFIVPAEYVSTVQTIINTWVSAYPGLTVNFNQPAFTAPIYNYITSFPNAVLDLQNGAKIRDAFYINAGVPDSSYRLGTPADLVNCDDIYAMPHADPQSWTLASGYAQTLKSFVTNGGHLWAACHSASALESLVDINGDGNPDMNFLSNAGLVPWGSHSDGTPPYNYSTSQGLFNPLIASDPFMQFVGTLDGALQNGSEQIYIPYSQGWRSTTKIGIYDIDHPQVTNGTYAPGPAAALVYGRGFGNSTYGMVMYEASHSIAGGTVAENVAAARIYGNFLLNAGIERRPELYNFSVSDSLETGDTINVSVSVTGGTPNYSITWTSTNGGSFVNPNALSTQFIAPTVTVATDCIIRVTVTDACGRINFFSRVVRVNPISYGTIGDLVWDDQNGNAIQDPGEPGISGVSVTLTRQNGTTVNATTDASGKYTFTNVKHGTYSISFTTPSGYVATTANVGSDDAKDSDPIGGTVSGIVLTSGQNNLTIDAGFKSTNLSLGKFVWDDQNNNGIQDSGEPFINGANVNLYNDANGDNIPDGVAVSTTTTNVGGVYSFTGLTPGNYIVGVVIPAGYAAGTTTATSSNPNNDNNSDNNGVTTLTGELRSNSIALTAGGEPTTDGDGSNGNLTLGFALKGTGSIGDRVWDDFNANGLQDSGEQGLAGVNVVLTYPNAVTVNLTTDANGLYAFNNLAPGTYTLTFTTPSGFTAASSNIGSDDTKDSDPIGGVVSGILLTAGQVNTFNDAGFVCIGIHTSSVQTACEIYNWHGVDYTTSGTYIYNYLSGTGCPSTDTLHLTVNYGTHNASTQVACETYNWHGTDYTTSGDYTYSYTNGAGCASVDTLHLTVNYGTHNASTQVACETYNWHGTDYTTSGDYTYSYTNGAGCASVDTLHLTVNYGTHNATTQVACETYNWHGTDYTTSGDYTYSYTNGAGCASVDTLHLTVNYGTHNASTQVACETYNWHGTDYTTSGDYTYSYTNGAGCASVDTLHLTVNYGTHNATTQVACETYNWHGTDYTTSGDYTYSYTNGAGCASVDTLHLTVNYGTHNASTQVACETYNWHGTDYTT
ncbi:SdrD B-like domain-containing protein, partial [Ferruginibacter sp. SUN002]|uniref:SdrD B-like domain-containing protein n=1 Tax=Ferruginibacter sp. SUN002 TaxID=2937789 RepID=UPI003D36C03E